MLSAGHGGKEGGMRVVFVSTYPHGARDMDPIPDAKEKLNLEDRKVILLAGYYWPVKCFDRVTDTEVYKRFSQNALAYVKEIISWDIVAHQTLNVYKQFDREMGCKTRYVFTGE